MEDQVEKIGKLFEKGWAARAAELNDEVIQSGVSPDNVRKWSVL